MARAARPSLQLACALAFFAACEVPVKIGSPFFSATGGGSAAGGSAAGGAEAGGGEAGGTAGGTAGGAAGGAPTAGGSGGSGGSGGCPAPLVCEGYTGTAYFSCIDPNRPDGVPANAPVCTDAMKCAVGWACWVESETATTGVCLQGCSGGPVRGIPQWVGAGAEVLISDAGSLSLSGPSSALPSDFYLAVIDADEMAGPLTATAPPGWSLLVGWPIHNLRADHPQVGDAGYDHGLWVYSAWAGDAGTVAADFGFNRPATARGVLFAYRDVNLTKPVNDKEGFGLYGDGHATGEGSGNTTLRTARQVMIVVTSPTPFAHRIRFPTSSYGGKTERINSGEVPGGLALLVYDTPIYPNLYDTTSVSFIKAPSNSTTPLMYGLTTILLKPRATP
ncbi:MAG: hypothetical protein IPJ65_22850 [Archangiaceae bacterium]|nr:hypothetical protein [Archangiaceae bacterium]